MLSTLIFVALATSAPTELDIYGRDLSSAYPDVPGRQAQPVPDTAGTGWSFKPWYALPGTDDADAVILGDLTADGRPELVLAIADVWANPSQLKTRIYSRTLAGTLVQRFEATAPSYPGGALAIGDFGANGETWLASIGSSGVHLHRPVKNGEQGFEFVRTLPGSATSVALALSTGKWGPDGLLTSFPAQLYSPTRSGMLAQPFTLAADGIHQATTADIDADGRLDIIYSGGIATGSGLRVLRARGVLDYVTAFETTVTCPGGWYAEARGVAVGDLNADGHLDIAFSSGGNRPRSCMAVVYGNSTGSFSAPTVLSSYDIPQTTGIADVNGDGRDDLLVLHGGWVRIGVYLQQANGSLAPELLVPIPYASHYYAQGLALGDFVGDGCVDAAIADYNYGAVILEGQNCAGAARDPRKNTGPSLAK